MGIEVGEDDTKKILMDKIDACIAALPDEVKGQSRDELIEMLEIHFEGAETSDAIPQFATLRDEELAVLLGRVMFSDLGAE